MPETTENGGAAEIEAAAGTAAEEAGDEGAAAPSKKRKKIKTSRRLRDLQAMERGLSKAAWRLSKAVTAGLATYRERSDKSARKKRDGALRDLPRNSAEAAARSLRVASRVPIDLARAVDTPTTRRLVRFSTRLVLFPFSR